MNQLDDSRQAGTSLKVLSSRAFDQIHYIIADAAKLVQDGNDWLSLNNIHFAKCEPGSEVDWTGDLSI